MARSDSRRPARRKPAQPSKPAKSVKARKSPSPRRSRALDSLVPLAPQGARPAPRGAPVIGPNLWLENEMRRLRDPADAALLYESWLQRYYRDRGHYPRDPKRAFRQAVRGCWERIARG